MPQKPIEIILTRMLASHLALPVFIVDNDGNLLFYNEPAEEILGRRFDETGEMPVDAWSALFSPTTEEGRPLTARELPLVIALRRRKPAHRRFVIAGLDGVRRTIAVTAFPLIGQASRQLGAVALFWEDEKR